jgi:hypothetical protein
MWKRCEITGQAFSSCGISSIGFANLDMTVEAAVSG